MADNVLAYTQRGGEHGDFPELRVSHITLHSPRGSFGLQFDSNNRFS